MKNILAFTGSNSVDSINRKLLEFTINETKKNTDFQISFIDLNKLDFPLYSIEEEKRGFPKDLKKLYDLFISADAFIFSSPEHNGLPSAFLKNIIDWLSRIEQSFFNQKPVLLLSTSPGKNSGASHLELLKKLMPVWGSKSSESFSLNNFFENFDQESNTIKDSELKEKFHKTITNFYNLI